MVQLARSQPAGYTAYTVKDGLPSNQVYQCAEDNDGFLWVATDAGIARFDGKYFQVFTIQQGLPDNEVLHVVKDTDGTIWVNCLRQSPAYFDAQKNRFINAREDTSLAKVSGTSNMHLLPVPGGGVMYFNESGSFVFRNRKLVDHGGRTHQLFIRTRNDGSQLVAGSVLRPGKQEADLWLYHYRNRRATDSVILKQSFGRFPYYSSGGGRLHVFSMRSGKAYVYSDFSNASGPDRIDSITIPEPYFSFSFAPGVVFLVSDSATIYVFDQQTLQPLYTIKGDFLPNGFYLDRKGNQWIGTVDKGLLVRRKQQLGQVKLPANYSRANFFSVTRRNGALLAGNYYGSVVETGNGLFKEHLVTKKTPSRIRKILIAHNKVFTISEDGVYINYTIPVMNTPNPDVAKGKTGMVYNDSLLVIGSFSSFLFIDSRSGKLVETHRYKRVTCLDRTAGGVIYFGSTDGLYRFHMASRSFESLAKLHVTFNERISAVAVTPDQLVWVATSGNGIVVMRNDTPLAHITTRDGIISNGGRSITAGQVGQVWLGTAVGLSMIRYKETNGEFDYSIQNLTVNDGLAGNEVNEMF
ncbi:MAG: hypothetical protein K0Q66_2327, partial [Chitinophagaceae bacterium]|nr:hypothetical protein [Chitinophagaceae bacterium]